jgi:hypothetical protein
MIRSLDLARKIYLSFLVLWPSVGGLAKLGELGNYFFIAQHHKITQEK